MTSVSNSSYTILGGDLQLLPAGAAAGEVLAVDHFIDQVATP
jgi:hypothetical protein